MVVTRIEDMNFSGFDYLDLGSSMGGSLKYGRELLKGTRGVGIDIDEAKVKTATEQGHACVLGDATNLPLPPDVFKFVTMMHFLEHLPNTDIATRVIQSSYRVARHFVYICGPYFDDDDYLANLGFKFYYSDWRGHTCHFTTTNAIGALEAMDVSDYEVFLNKPVFDSLDPSIHPMDSPRDQHAYDPARHPAKTATTFDRCLYQEFICIGWKDRTGDWSHVARAKNQAIRII